MTGNSSTPPLVRAPRYRRHLGRTTLARGKTPRAPDIYYGGGLWVVIFAVAILIAALYAISVAITIAIDVGTTLAVLLALRSFHDWIVPVVRGGVFNSKAFATSSPVATFTMGALPAGALAYATLPQPLTVAASAIAGGIAFRPLALALDGKRFEPSSFLPARRRQAQPDADFDYDAPGNFGLWIGEATGTLPQMGHRAGITPRASVTLNLPDAAKNIAIFGETGTGKTTRVINHLLVQALDFDASALIFRAHFRCPRRLPRNRASCRTAHRQDRPRALNVVAIVAAQSVEAYINATGNEHTANALLANFTNIIAFRSTERTMNYVAGKLGEVDV